MVSVTRSAVTESNMAATPAKQDNQFSPLAAIQEALGPAYQEILTWAVGPDWEDVDMRQWPDRMKERVLFVIPEQEDVYQSFERLKARWDRRNDNKPQSARPEGKAPMAEGIRHVVRPDASAAPTNLGALGNGQRAESASAAAADHRSGSGSGSGSGAGISEALLEAVLQARQRQRQAWGDTSGWALERWVALVSEQQGDMARVVNQGKSLRLLKEELIHAIALLIAWADEGLGGV
jgi:hypothetical protein